MSPQLEIDVERLFNVLVVIIVASFFIERALALVFENRWLVDRISNRGLKEPIAFAVSFVICRHWDFDAISVLFAKPGSQVCGNVVTAAIIAGGSKASMKLFHDVLGAMSTAEEERQQKSPAPTPIRPETPKTVTAA